MKIIGKKYSYFIWMFLGIILFLAIIIAFLIHFTKSGAGWPFILPLVGCLGIFFWYAYYVFLLPEDIVSFDETNKKIVIKENKLSTKEIELSNVKDISLKKPFNRAAWYKVIITLKDGNTIEATGIEEDNEIIQSLYTLKK